MMKQMTIALTMLSLLSNNNVKAITKFGEQCPWTYEYSVEQSFDKSRYTGRWYEIQRDYDTSFEWMSDCVTATYKAKSDGTLGIINRGWYWYFFLSYYQIEGKAKCDENEGYCTVGFNPLNPDDVDVDGKEPNYNILMTDYDTYSVVYSCSSSWNTWAMTETMWILSRTTTLP